MEKKYFLIGIFLGLLSVNAISGTSSLYTEFNNKTGSSINLSAKGSSYGYHKFGIEAAHATITCLNGSNSAITLNTTGSNNVKAFSNTCMGCVAFPTCEYTLKIGNNDIGIVVLKNYNDITTCKSNSASYSVICSIQKRFQRTGAYSRSGSYTVTIAKK